MCAGSRAAGESVDDVPFDVMLEARAKDLALLKLLRDLDTLSPGDVAGAFGGP